ncbi:putative ethanolamine-phosphate cytidylytransferase [Encephalitozoon hellem ATCC 50504]|uniref:ethanolamine-phosphate cytidylyltransferase n=1 Tax=Encephalitozoon hellem TaxID=27973 RepID=A0A9Q9CCJ7_ENCHE|nr:putative ethanolamine-phosphate cytidylytransferase [Encephalitozoon hellem ATCC 50504]AFM99349.1 putative ethanolamine-phosphate cytidylytransferase [Encephalitozoon hellem ATCC 50504]UTX44353.1 ethanolamine-phosphate cytidylyltransferase [Encephalitozoon hellem]WEL39854.1 choline-phosphate cytidylyltransferase [Encephalitozoon hellem]|eukprot:XP_003888330.1 putative ethanolamine-phosphate cytidylytransferase [Encephalitozoon hellem ATCC 50504]
MASHEIRKVWADGCFDMFHYGHANALRQSKALGDYLIAGVHSSLSINQEKGLPVMEDDERYEVVQGCRYVDEIVRDAPFVTQMDMIKEYGVNVVAHGNDIILDSNGQDSYFQVRKTGMFREVERTIGISTTETVGRMMLKSRGSCIDVENGECNKNSKYHDELINLFMSSMKREKKGRIVFVDGNFDLFHAGHVVSLRIAREMGDYLIVGIHDDETTKEYTRNYPVLSTKERMLTLMSCRYVDEVVVSPYLVGGEFVEKHGINVVGPSFDTKDLSRYDKIKEMVEHSYAENRFNYLSAEHIVNRIISNYQDYANRQKKRMKN